MTDKNNKNGFLTKEEKEVSKFLETTEPIADSKLINKLQAAAKAHNTKSERISLRVLPSDLEAVRMRAARNGIPYQTLINALIHQFATGQVDLNS